MAVPSVTTGELCAALQPRIPAELVGDAQLPIRRIAALADAGPDEISFVQPRYRAQIQSTRAGCLIVPPVLRDEAAARGAVIVTPDPYLGFAYLTQWWAAHFGRKPTIGVHPSAVVADDAVLGEGVSVGAQAVVESGAVLGDGVVVGALGFVGAGVVIGAGTKLAPRVTLMPGTVLGQRCILHSGVVIGADGFGFAPVQGRWEKIEQLGGVQIGDDVEIGANTCIDRGALEDTLIATGVKLDNLIQIAHNVQIGEHSAMAGCVGIAGSTKIGKGCTVGGAGMIIGHLELADGVHISAGTMVARSIREPGQYTGVFPLAEHATWEKNAATLRQLHGLRDRVRTLEKGLKALDDPNTPTDNKSPT